jgi:hypothetical protein
MARLVEITPAGYKLEVQWECELGEIILANHPELIKFPIIQHSFLNTLLCKGIQKKKCGFTLRYKREIP